MKGMCHECYSSGVELTLTEVQKTENNPIGPVLLPLCKKCRETENDLESQSKLYIAQLKKNC